MYNHQFSLLPISYFQQTLHHLNHSIILISLPPLHSSSLLPLLPPHPPFLPTRSQSNSPCSPPRSTTSSPFPPASSILPAPSASLPSAAPGPSASSSPPKPRSPVSPGSPFPAKSAEHYSPPSSGIRRGYGRGSTVLRYSPSAFVTFSGKPKSKFEEFGAFEAVEGDEPNPWRDPKRGNLPGCPILRRRIWSEDDLAGFLRGTERSPQGAR